MSYVHLVMVISFVAWFTAQTLKVVGGVIRDKRLDLRFFVRSGGMPSAHAAVVFAGVVMYDAAGVRQSVSKQSVILNRLLQELMEKRPKDIQNDVRELIGHTPFQVFTGGLLGASIALVWLLIIGDLRF